MAKPTEKKSEELLGDLESIRTLLDEQAEQAPVGTAAATEATEPATSATPEEAVPMLDDVVDLPDTADDEDDAVLNDDLFATLMGDGWKDKADDLLENARTTIDNQSDQWSPEDTDELNNALRVRIDGTIYEFLQKMLTEHIDELRAQVLDAMSDEIKQRVKQALDEVHSISDPTSDHTPNQADED